MLQWKSVTKNILLDGTGIHDCQTHFNLLSCSFSFSYVKRILPKSLNVSFLLLLSYVMVSSPGPANHILRSHSECDDLILFYFIYLLLGFICHPTSQAGSVWVTRNKNTIQFRKVKIPENNNLNILKPIVKIPIVSLGCCVHKLGCNSCFILTFYKITYVKWT